MYVVIELGVEHTASVIHYSWIEFDNEVHSDAMSSARLMKTKKEGSPRSLSRNAMVPDYTSCVVG